MKGIICYCSGSGNTQLACRYIAGRMNNIEFDLFDIMAGSIPDLEKCDVVGRELKRKNIFPGFINSLMPAFSVTKARDDMGAKYVDEALCTECGLWGKLCPYEAIKCSLKPVFDMNIVKRLDSDPENKAARIPILFQPLPHNSMFHLLYVT